MAVVAACAQPVPERPITPALIASSKPLLPSMGHSSPRLVEDRWRIPPGKALSIEVELDAGGDVGWRYTANGRLHWTTWRGVGSLGVVDDEGDAVAGEPSLRGGAGRCACTWRNDTDKPIVIQVEVDFLGGGKIASIGPGNSRQSMVAPRRE